MKEYDFSKMTEEEENNARLLIALENNDKEYEVKTEYVYNLVQENKFLKNKIKKAIDRLDSFNNSGAMLCNTIDETLIILNEEDNK